LSWTYSLARLFIPWIGMLSITVAFHKGEHVAMGMISGVLPERFATVLRYLVLASIALFAMMLLWFGWHFFVSTTQYYMVSDQLQVHGRWVAACVPLSGAILLIHLVNGAALLEAQRPEAAGDGPGLRARDTRSARLHHRGKGLRN